MRPLSNPFQLFDIAALFGLSVEGNMSEDQPFRLLHLPREIRNMIYHAILCDWGVQGPFHHHLTDDSKEIRLQIMARKVELNILFANKQIYQEAKQVFLEGNQFIRIKISARNRSPLIYPFSRSSRSSRPSRSSRSSQIAVIASGRESVYRFRNITVMEHIIEFPGDQSDFGESEIDAIILQRDLRIFATNFALLDTYSRRFVGQSKHQICIHNPFEETECPGFLKNTKNLEKLLGPYLKKFQGFEDVKLSGKIDEDVAKSMVAQMNSERPLTSPPSKLIDKVINLQSLGDQLYLENKYKPALKAWNTAQMALLAQANRKAWPTFIQTAGKDFTDHLSDVAFQVEISRIRVYLSMIEADPSSGDVNRITKSWVSHLTNKCTDALQVGETLGTGWTPTDDRKATIYYCWAKGYRLAGDDVQFAEDAIRLADHLRPDDEEIGAEMEKIAEWKHNMGLP
ncbi:hypothetical protein KVR01_009424 [Diaporthe batatas]|uniref:uncharacterized protein n=1 Tax=Diaporthe batatas TaxID=748121 RepID=UPI001D0550F6|nr:uncharacterized protein KVR01_009424 [Diaporthe batatas]KAG8161160.1 hypothetical protein KVR01_009424 [Diaporthe batatas]